ncbi:MAG: hypothetical protein RIC14_05655 [Filomicrobium sp.]
MSFSVRGGHHVAALATVDARFRDGLSRAANIAGASLKQELEQGMKAANVPSNPGGYPGVRSGRLISSVGYEVSGHRFLRFGQGPVLTGTKNAVIWDYAKLTHEGTSKMAPRPGVKIAVEAKRDDIERILGQVTFKFMVGGR